MSPFRRTRLAVQILGHMWLAQGAGLGPALTSQARAQARTRIEVRVIEVAGKRAYVSPGEDRHLTRGDTVVIRRRRYRVLAASAESALIDLDDARLRVGQTGWAQVSETETGEVQRLPQPEPLATFRRQWPRARLPASEQHPRHVPLGQPTQPDDRALAIMLAAGGTARASLAGPARPIGRGFLRLRMRASPFAGVPLAFDVDLALQRWFASDLDARAGRRSRPPAQVYALLARYGEPLGLYGAIGRLRYAASGLGTLDGVRVQVPVLPTLNVAAFGGFVPRPLDGVPDSGTSRFGMELVYEDLETGLRPRLSLTTHGSRFAGQLDERRLLLQADLFPGMGHAGAYAQLSLFDAGNPWNAPERELTAAGARGVLRLGRLQFGARFDMQRPERSLRLSSFLPESWLCIARPAPPSATPETCYGDETRYLAQADMGLRFARVAFDVAATASKTTHVDADQLGGFVHLRVQQILEQARVDVTLSGSRGSLLQTAALTMAPGIRLTPGLDLALRYRPAVTRYRADEGPFIEHGAGASLWFTPRPDVDLRLDTDTVYGRDVGLVLVQLLTTFHL